MSNLEKKKYVSSLVVMAGLPLTGKTTMAKELEKCSNFTLIDVDEVRHLEMPIVRVLVQEEEKKAVENTYVKMFEMADSMIKKSKPVIIAGVFSRPDPYHNQLKSFVSRLAIPLKFFYMEPPSIDELERRIQFRKSFLGNLSNVTSYERFAEVENRYKLIEGIEIIKISSALSIEEKLSLIKENLNDLKLR